MVCYNGYTQVNLVPNPSFEDTLACPWSNSLGGIDQLAICTGNWHTATEHTPDYFHACANGLVAGVPHNTLFGYQPAYNGNAYGGFGAGEVTNQGINSEYIETELIEPMEPCALYEVSFWVSLADYSSDGVRGLGAYLTEEKFYEATYKTLTITPQIKYTGSFLADTSTWVQIIDTFQAKGCERFIVIGYFEQDYTNDTQYVQPIVGAFCCRFAYYYLDDVSVKKIADATEICDCKTPEIPNVFTPNGDGINDELLIKNLSATDQIQIVNRWGVTVREYDGTAPAWDGKNAAGDDCTEGVYYVAVKTKAKEYKGLVHLFR